MEFLDVVDDEDVVVGCRPRNECLGQGILHRAIAILLFDELGQIYIQKRADSKNWYPSYWTLSVMGHVSSGETYEKAAKRELAEELAVDCPLTAVFKMRMPDYPYRGLVEREFLTVFEGHLVKPRISLSAETKESRFVTLEGLGEMARKQPNEFTPDSVLAFETYMKSVDAK